MNEITQITKAPETYVLTLPQKPWYQQEVIVSLTGVLVGFILGFLATILKEHIQKKSKIKRMVTNLYNEIGLNYAISKKSIESTNDIKNRFTALTSTIPQGVRSDTPRIEYFGISNADYYNTHFGDLDLLDYELQKRVAHFYSVMKGIDGRSKSLAEMFKDYYNGNTTVKSGDILTQLSKLIEQYEATEVVGVESLGIISYSYNHILNQDENTKEEIKKFTKIIEEFINKQETNKIFMLRELSKNTKVHLLTCAFILLQLKSVKSEAVGKYKKI